MKVDVLARGVIPDLSAWLVDRAAAEGVTAADIINRALAHERHRLGDGPRLDPRTKMPGRRGADGKVPPGLYHINDLAVLAQIPRTSAVSFAQARALVPARPSSKGIPAAYPGSEALVAAVLHEVHRFGIELGCVAERVRDAPKSRGVSLVVTGSDVILCGDANLGAIVRREGGIVVVSLEALDRRIHDAMVAA